MSNLFKEKQRSEDNVYLFSPKKSKNGYNGNGGDGGDMDNLIYKVQRLEEQFERIESDLSEKPSKKDAELQNAELKLFIQEQFNKIPTEDRIKTIIAEQLLSASIATKEHVEKEVIKSKNHLIFWIVGLVIAAGLSATFRLWYK